MRSAINLFRGLIYGTGGLNVLAALDRLGSEVGSIFTDNILAGLAAMGVGKTLDARMGGYSNGWSDFQTIGLFQEVARHSPDEQAFLKGLAERLSEQDQPQAKQICLATLKKVWEKTDLSPDAKREMYTKLAAQMAKDLGLTSFDQKIGEHIFPLDNLFSDVGLFRDQMTKLTREQAGTSWHQLAEHTLGQTRKIKNIKLLPSILLGMLATYSLPPIIAWAGKRFFGVDYYPGDMGLKGRGPDSQAKAVAAPPVPVLFTHNQVFRSFHENRPRGSAPEKNRYVKEQFRKGNIWPSLLALVPLPFAVGLFDTVRLKWRNPFKFKSFLKQLQQDYDFSKAKPFTTQPQIASMFALLITSRLLTARSDNEFRDRLLDSGLGWIAWILATPFFQRSIAGVLDRTGQTMLLKEVEGRKVLRTRAEIEHLLPSLKGASHKVAENTLRRYIQINAGSTMLTMILLGIAAPLLGILWSRHNSRQKEATMQQAVPQQAFTPQPTAIQQNHFRY
ncbi:MAG TPA: hypothetical protein V6C52_07245 [Coleofasciculaceae cyanobacterium]